MYAPVAAQLGLDRATAKVAMLGAMYGQTTGHGLQALRRLEAAYPVAMRYLADAARSGQAGNDLRTYGGRLIILGPANAAEVGRAKPVGWPQPGAATAVMLSSKARRPSCSRSGQ